jgi:D-alanyl-D-alanine carboxypeptidase
MVHVLEIYFVFRLLLGAPLDTLVTRDQGLPQWYAPGENAEARMALEEMTIAAERDGVLLWVNSGYRDFSYQAKVLNRGDDRSPDVSRSFSAEPGHSEHQLGTAYDVAWPGLMVESTDPRNQILFQWLTANAHRFGFVISYPYKEIPDWPYHNRWLPVVTEYIYEPWHIRFVGLDLAGEIERASYLVPGDPTLPQDFYSAWPWPDF